MRIRLLLLSCVLAAAMGVPASAQTAYFEVTGQFNSACGGGGGFTATAPTYYYATQGTTGAWSVQPWAGSCSGQFDAGQITIRNGGAPSASGSAPAGWTNWHSDDWAVNVFVEGEPGTPYQAVCTYAGSLSVSNVANTQATMSFTSAGGLTASVLVPPGPGTASITDYLPASRTLQGVTGTETRTVGGVTYSLGLTETGRDYRAWTALNSAAMSGTISSDITITISVGSPPQVSSVVVTGLETVPDSTPDAAQYTAMAYFGGDAPPKDVTYDPDCQWWVAPQPSQHSISATGSLSTGDITEDGTVQVGATYKDVESEPLDVKVKDLDPEVEIQSIKMTAPHKLTVRVGVVWKEEEAGAATSVGAEITIGGQTLKASPQTNRQDVLLFVFDLDLTNVPRFVDNTTVEANAKASETGPVTGERKAEDTKQGRILLPVIIIPGLGTADTAGSSTWKNLQDRICQGVTSSEFVSFAGEGKMVYVVQYNTRTAASLVLGAGSVYLRAFSIMAASHAGRVNLVGHSLGGLVARRYSSLPTQLVPLPVRTLVTVGTPHLGSTCAAMIDLGVPKALTVNRVIGTTPAGRSVLYPTYPWYTSKTDPEYHLTIPPAYRNRGLVQLNATPLPGDIRCHLLAGTDVDHWLIGETPHTYLASRYSPRAPAWQDGDEWTVTSGDAIGTLKSQYGIGIAFPAGTQRRPFPGVFHMDQMTYGPIKAYIAEALAE